MSTDTKTSHLLWKKNPDFDTLMTFEDDPYMVFEINKWNANYEYIWFVDPRFVPINEKVWAMSVSTKGKKIFGVVDMGYLTPSVYVEYNNHLPDLAVDIDQCCPPVWELENECAYELDPIHQTPELTERMWVVKFTPAWRDPKEWKWMGVITPVAKIEFNPDLPSLEYDLDYTIPWHDLAYKHLWYLNNSDPKVWCIQMQATNNPIGEKEIGVVTPLFKDQLDVIFISYKESNAEENWQRVLEKAPWAKRVDGVDGIFNAHKAAAKLAKTDMFFVVDGDAYLTDEWQFNFQPGIFDRDCAYVWHSINPVNDLIYENGGIKLFPRAVLMKKRKWKTLDMFTTISNKIKVVDTVSNITTFNTDEFSAWRSAFRECVKLYTFNQMNKLNTWLTKGEDRHHGSYVISGANAGYQYAKDNKDNQEVLNNINNYEWLRKQFNLNNE